MRPTIKITAGQIDFPFFPAGEITFKRKILSHFFSFIFWKKRFSRERCNIPLWWENGKRHPRNIRIVSSARVRSRRVVGNGKLIVFIHKSYACTVHDVTKSARLIVQVDIFQSISFQQFRIIEVMLISRQNRKFIIKRYGKDVKNIGSVTVGGNITQSVTSKCLIPDCSHIKMFVAVYI